MISLMKKWYSNDIINNEMIKMISLMIKWYRNDIIYDKNDIEMI